MVVPLEGDAPIAPTPADLLEGGGELLPPAASAALAARARELRAEKDRVRPGSRPSIPPGAFLQYAVSGMPAQGQQGNVPLNAARAPGAPALQSVLPEAGAAELAALLRRAMLRLVDDFASPDSGDVDYEHMQDSPQWGTFLAVASELASDRLWADLLASSTAQRKAFFINLYNAMTFHPKKENCRDVSGCEELASDSAETIFCAAGLVGRVGLARGGLVRAALRPGLWNLYCFFIAPAVSYLVAGVPLSLDDVENGLLRVLLPKFSKAKSDGDQETQHKLFSVCPSLATEWKAPPEATPDEHLAQESQQLRHLQAQQVRIKNQLIQAAQTQKDLQTKLRTNIDECLATLAEIDGLVGKTQAAGPQMEARQAQQAQRADDEEFPELGTDDLASLGETTRKQYKKAPTAPAAGTAKDQAQETTNPASVDFTNAAEVDQYISQTAALRARAKGVASSSATCP
ncbi:unnamed protein product [Prorocentrum cordatum]|uniref:DUF547 domain-containing protein n=1 Tax=Prorocentrum cordatum TaxID=2364126 RepID=A0ABN9V4A5_9DINO|nr:unnamed protein product [Polarella glacialis]